jgi:hypothetical protein
MRGGRRCTARRQLMSSTTITLAGCVAITHRG